MAVIAAWMTQARDLADVDRGYLHWDELRHRKPPDGLSLREWWAVLKLRRQSGMRRFPARDDAGRPFVYSLPDEVLELLQIVDSQLSGQIVVSEQVTDPAQRDRYIIGSLMNEAITSSQLEGAATTYRAAKEMLRTGRAPRTRDERMILNNFRAMRFVQEVRDQPLSRATILRLHEILTEGTLDEPHAAGRFRKASEDVRVYDIETGEIVHVPPPAAELDERIRALVEFANGSSGGPYVPPVVRAVLLHLWLAYDHPFIDGNGRTARTLFYWSMLKTGYWLSEYISLSKVLHAAPPAYARAFLHTETDGNDATYFLLHQLRALRVAIDDLVRFIRRKQREVLETERRLRPGAGFNHRQLALLSHALRHLDASYTMRSHGASHGVVYATARADLMALHARGLLEQRRVGKSFVFSPVPDLAARLSRRGKAQRPRRARGSH